MRRSLPLCLLAAITATTAPAPAARAQGTAMAPAPGATGDNLIINAARATTWADGPTNVVQLEGPLTIDLDKTRLSADQAVVWLAPLKGSLLQEQEAQIALIGTASIDQQGIARRDGDRLFVTAVVRGVIRVTANDRKIANAENTETYQAARRMRPLPPDATGDEIDTWSSPRPATGPATTQSTTQATTRPDLKQRQPIAFSADHIETAYTSEGTVALVLNGKVKLFQRRTATESIEMQCDRAVLFTPLRSTKEIQAGEQYQKVEEAIVSAFLEDDVRIVHSPGKGGGAEQRMTAHRVYYDFETDRAILTDAVLHTVEPQKQIPVIMRAQTIRQLSQGEYRADRVRLTQSSFYTPSYAIGLRSAYVRQVDTGDPNLGTLTNITGKGMTLQVMNQPLFYWPVVGGSLTERGAVLRNFELVSGSKYGTGFKTDLGLFELLGKLPPEDTDAELSLDYYSSRGPAAGLTGTYAGGFVTEQTKQPWAFEGSYDTYVVNDSGKDDLGRRRLDVTPPQDLRYRLVFEHQHFFPDNWQVQLTGAAISDATFQEEWFKNAWDKQRPLDTAFYAKHQDQTEAFTFLYSVQPNDFVTAATLVQEQAEVERVPEIGYHRIGDNLGGDETGGGVTFFSDNSVGGYRFKRSNEPLGLGADGVGGQGFKVGDSPGLPSFGRTGTPSGLTYRGDFRQEIDFPISAGQFRVVPYVMGRYTWYSQSPDAEQSSNDRLLAGAGLRVTTAFWKVDDSAQSELFDIHRLRHVIEPELNLFTSAQTTGRDRLYQYDEPVDEVNDISALQLAVNQRWQTKRGGVGRWRSVDVLTLNVEANFFANKPKDDPFAPQAFRGLYFNSLPEASLPRDGINADLVWRITDTTTILADAQYNINQSTLSTASIGLAVSRDVRLAYFIGMRYIDAGQFTVRTAGGTLDDRDLHSVVLSGAVNYELTPKYTIAAQQSFDFGENQKLSSRYSLIRHFDRWYAAVSLRVDYVTNESGIFFSVFPEGLGSSTASSERLQQVFR